MVDFRLKLIQIDSKSSVWLTYASTTRVPKRSLNLVKLAKLNSEFVREIAEIQNHCGFSLKIALYVGQYFTRVLSRIANVSSDSYHVFFPLRFFNLQKQSSLNSSTEVLHLFIQDTIVIYVKLYFTYFVPRKPQ